MCFNFANSKKAREVARRYGKKTDIIEAWKEIIEENKRNGNYNVNFLSEEQYNIPAFTKPNCMIITEDENVQVMQWGLRTMNMTSKSIEKYNKENWFVNGQSEELAGTYPYKFLLDRQRCIIPVTGYIEPHYPEPKSKAEAWFVHLKSQDIFSIAGLWDKYINPQTLKKTNTFTLITQPANQTLQKAHNGGRHPFRMPVIIRPEDETDWLNTELKFNKVDKLLKTPYPDEDMEVWRADKSYYQFNRKGPYDKKIIKK